MPAPIQNPTHAARLMRQIACDLAETEDRRPPSDLRRKGDRLLECLAVLAPAAGVEVDAEGMVV